MKPRKKLPWLVVGFGLWMYPFPGGHAGTADPIWTPKRYHSTEEQSAMAKLLEKNYPALVHCSTVGESTQGRPLWVLEITAVRSGPATDKPALWIGGGLEGDEVVGGEAALAAAEHLCRTYDNDSRIRDLLDRAVLYIMPSVNPDAVEATLRNPGMPLSAGLRPTDSDRDGKTDEDPAEDLDGDGVVAWMRWKDPGGKFRACPDDPRVLQPVRFDRGEMPEYRLEREGLDNDRDGAINEDGPGGIDLDRNFPAGWKMNHEAPGSGLYPGSEPESECVMRFLIEHPNVAAAVVLRSGEPVHVRPFGFRPDKDIPAVDMGVFQTVGRMLLEKTGIPFIHRFPEPSASPRTADSEGLFGALGDWIYRDFGAYALSPTLWTLPESFRNPSDSAGTPGILDSGWIRFFETENINRGFVPWKPFSHSHLGNVEIGGLSVFYMKNPPVGKYLEHACRQFSSWIVDVAELLPRISIRSVVVEPLVLANGTVDFTAEGGGKDGIRIVGESSKTGPEVLLALVTITIQNQGSLGTCSALGQKTRYAHQPLRSVLAFLDVSEGTVDILTSPKVLRFGTIEGSLTRDLLIRERETAGKEKPDESSRQGREGTDFLKDIDKQPPDVKTGTWLIRMTGASASCTIRVDADKGGTIRKTFTINR